MKYELLLQATAPGGAYDGARVEALLVERGATPKADGGLEWRLKSGPVEVLPLREGGRQVATELRLGLSDDLSLIRELVSEGVQVAAAGEVLLFDPQLCRAVASREDGGVAEQYLRTAKYAGEMMGVQEALGASYSPPPTPGLKPGTKVLLAIIGFFVLLYLVADALTSRL